MITVHGVQGRYFLATFINIRGNESQALDEEILTLHELNYLITGWSSRVIEINEADIDKVRNRVLALSNAEVIVSGDYVPLNEKGSPLGLATLDSTGRLPTAQLPNDLAAVAFSGDKSDIGLSNVDNTNDLDKPISSATQTALATKATVTVLNEVKTLAESNQLNIGTKVDQVDFDSVSATVTSQGLTLLNKADISTLTTLAQLVNTKADQSYVISEIARITGNAPAALDTLAEIAEQLGNDQTQINNLLDQIGNRVRFDAAQALTAPQQTQARDNINAEAKGVAASLVSNVTTTSIGAATAAEGAKANTALQSGDVAPVALSGSFNDLVNKSSLFSLVYSAYAIGSNVAIAATDTLGQMLGKLQAQISSNVTAINAKEPNIVLGNTTQYWRGDKTWQTLATDVRGTVLTGLSTATNTAIVATDNVLNALGKVQAQIADNKAGLAINAEDISSINLRAGDLVSNGFGQLKSNKYFSAFTYNATDRPTGLGSFVVPFVNLIIGDELIPVDPLKYYKLSYYIRQKSAGVVGYTYGLVAPYDVDGLQILPFFYMARPSTLTTLAADLKSGDTVMQLTSAANWINNAGSNTNSRSAIFWNYVDGSGYAWPENTYSRNWSSFDFYLDGGISENTVTLRVPYSGATIPAGTKVSNGSSGASYMYIGASNVVTPETWTNYSGVFGGTHPSGTLTPATNKLPMMTAYVKVGWLPNRQANGSLQAGSVTAVAGVSLRDWSTVVETNTSLTSLTDVQITSKNNNDTLKWNTSTNKWINAPMTGNQEIYVQSNQPISTGKPYIWIQTGLPGQGVTLWVDNGE